MHSSLQSLMISCTKHKHLLTCGNGVSLKVRNILILHETGITIYGTRVEMQLYKTALDEGSK